MGDHASSSRRPPYSPSYVPNNFSYFPRHSYTLPPRASVTSAPPTPLHSARTAPTTSAQSDIVEDVRGTSDGISSAPLYACTLCRRSMKPREKAYFISSQSGPGTVNIVGAHTLCEDCWIWTYNLAICWSCGEVVSRNEERVSFGWCWWHWGCLACLVCRFPVQPPQWRGEEIALGAPPLCKQCSTSRPRGSEDQVIVSSTDESAPSSEDSSDDSVPTRRATPEASPGAWREVTPPETPIDRPSHVSVFRPLDGGNSYSPQALRPLPPWLTDTSPLAKPPTFPDLARASPDRPVQPSTDGSEADPPCRRDASPPRAPRPNAQTWPPTTSSASTRRAAAPRSVPAPAPPPLSSSAPRGPPTFNRASSRPAYRRSEAAAYLDGYSRTPSAPSTPRPRASLRACSSRAAAARASVPRARSGIALATLLGTDFDPGLFGLPRAASSTARMTPVCRGAAGRPARVRGTAARTPGERTGERGDDARRGADDGEREHGAEGETVRPAAVAQGDGHGERAERVVAARATRRRPAVPSRSSLSALIASRANVSDPPPGAAEHVVVRRVRWPSFSDSGATGEAEGGIRTAGASSAEDGGLIPGKARKETRAELEASVDKTGG